MTDRLTKFNAETGEYEYKERAKTQEEFNAQRKAVIQRLGEFEDLALRLGISRKSVGNWENGAEPSFICRRLIDEFAKTIK